MLAPQGGIPTQTPNFTGGGQQAPQTQQMQQSGKPAKPVVHGLVNADEIDTRLAQMPREAQQMFLKGATEFGMDLATLFGIAIGPEAHDYVAAVVQAIQQQQQQKLLQ